MFHALEKFNKKEALKELRMRKATTKVQMKPIAVIALSQSLSLYAIISSESTLFLSND